MITCPITLFAGAILIFGTDAHGIICGDFSKGYTMHWPGGGWREDEKLPHCILSGAEGYDYDRKVLYVLKTPTKVLSWICIDDK